MRKVPNSSVKTETKPKVCGAPFCFSAVQHLKDKQYFVMEKFNPNSFLQMIADPDPASNHHHWLKSTQVIFFPISRRNKSRFKSVLFCN